MNVNFIHVNYVYMSNINLYSIKKAVIKNIHTDTLGMRPNLGLKALGDTSSVSIRKLKKSTYKLLYDYVFYIKMILRIVGFEFHLARK